MLNRPPLLLTHAMILLWHDLSFFALLFKISQALTVAVDLAFLPQAKLGLSMAASQW